MIIGLMLGFFFLCIYIFAKKQVAIMDKFMAELKPETKIETKNGITTKYIFIPKEELLRPEEEFDTTEVDRMIDNCRNPSNPDCIIKHF